MKLTTRTGRAFPFCGVRPVRRFGTHTHEHARRVKMLLGDWPCPVIQKSPWATIPYAFLNTRKKFVLSIDLLYYNDFHLYKLIRSFTNISPFVKWILLLLKNPSNDWIVFSIIEIFHFWVKSFLKLI